MARGRGHGGYRKPGSPAAVSGPGALSARTDGGPGDLEYSGLPYGENQAVNSQAAAAPIGPGGGGSGAGVGPGGPPPGSQSAFGPTARPGEPMTAGVDFGPGQGAQQGPVLAENPDLFLQALAQKYPHPDLVALVNRRRS